MKKQRAGLSGPRSIAVVLLLPLMLQIAGAHAGPPDKPTVYSNNPMGRAAFDHALHKRNNLKCGDCHAQLFEEETGATPISFDQHHEQKACFSCHEVSYEDTGNCMDCHQLGQGEPGG